VLTHTIEGADWLIDRKELNIGTHVEMTTDTRSTRTLDSVFTAASSPDDPGFTRTHIPVRLAEYGEENLISRSQAKRLVTRLERFKEVVLDFGDVNIIGQAFADEIFRVFQNEHPDVHLTPVRANHEVSRMIAHVLAGAAERSQQPKTG
jgi:uncharacterized protein DUF4325